MSVKIIIFSCLLARVDLSQMERLAVQLDYGGADRVMELAHLAELRVGIVILGSRSRRGHNLRKPIRGHGHSFQL